MFFSFLMCLFLIENRKLMCLINTFCFRQQETDVSIAREVDKDLDDSGNQEGGEGDSASARHAAREKQREASVESS